MAEYYKSEKKKDSFWRNLKWQGLITVVLGIGLIFFYGYHITSLHAIWELGDEAGYLWNAAFFTRTDWDSFAGGYPYYGYGYSILLIPLFWITNNGIQLIRAAYVINVLCVLGMYLILVKLLKEISKRPHSLSIPIIAYISCMMPYVVSNTLKVLCEVFLSFWYNLLVLLIILAVKKQNNRYMIFAGICGTFIFFIHTRSIVVLGTFVLVLFIDTIKKKEKHLRHFIIPIIVMGGIFVVLHLIKSHIVDYMSMSMRIAGMGTEVGNIVKLNTLSTILQGLDLINYFSVFWIKIFYTICATGAILVPGLLCMCKCIYVFLKKKDHMIQERTVSIAVIFVISTYILTLISLIYMGTGGELRYVMYGRYYEYMFPTILSFCMYFLIEDNENISIKEMFMCLIFMMCIGIMTRMWCVSHLSESSIMVDTNRLAALSKAISIHDDLGTVIEFLILICAIYMFFYILVYRKRYAKWLILPMVLMILWINDSICLDEIHAIHNRVISDTEIAKYLIDNADSHKIYMLDDNSFRIPYYYSKMQIYLKDNRLYVIKPEQNGSIEDGSFVMVYSSTELKDTILSEYYFLMEGQSFILYRK